MYNEFVFIGVQKIERFCYAVYIFYFTFVLYYLTHPDTSNVKLFFLSFCK